MRLTGVLIALIGGLLLVPAVNSLNTVSCGSGAKNQPTVHIEPGETCEFTSFWTREEVVRSYEEQKRADDMWSYGLIAAEGTWTALGVWMIVSPGGWRPQDSGRRPA
ncbi:hypothetical protein [Marinactinospora rubrisoli]|uniref:Transmembrane protein n=1 Tax=Marinactinospora rubrisoli TaxID=2715399 RepID=A0ABW2KM19_9ACTN